MLFLLVFTGIGFTFEGPRVNSNPLTSLGLVFHSIASPFEQYTGEIFYRVGLKLYLHCPERAPNWDEENAA